jgi:hypothetical protein
VSPGWVGRRVGQPPGEGGGEGTCAVEQPRVQCGGGGGVLRCGHAPEGVHGFLVLVQHALTLCLRPKTVGLQ